VGVEYVMVIGVGGSLPALRTLAREIIPEFGERSEVRQTKHRPRPKPDVNILIAC
jgi:hypothetical protein